MAFLRDRSVFCIPNITLDHDDRLAISLICISTSTVGFIGAVLQLRYLWQYRHRQRRRPSADPRIIFYLALSDLITCIGRPIIHWLYHETYMVIFRLIYKINLDCSTPLFSFPLMASFPCLPVLAWQEFSLFMQKSLSNIEHNHKTYCAWRNNHMKMWPQCKN